MNIHEQLTEVFRNVFADDSIEIKPETTVNDIEGWDSLSHVNLIIAIELKFGFEFTQNEIRSFSNVGEMEKCITQKVNNK
jgi:acyl carrier protein